MLDPLLYQLNAEVHQSIFENDIMPDLFNNVQTSQSPFVVLFGGQPGAGKSASIDMVVRESTSQTGIVQIIGDDLRGYHPKYSDLLNQNDKTAAFFTDRDTGLWIEKAIQFAVKKQTNTVVEGTMRDSQKVITTIQQFHQAGFHIEARILAVPYCLSLQGILQRYENQKLDRGFGRMTTKQAHDVAFFGLLNTVECLEQEKLVDTIGIYKRGGEAIYVNKLINGCWELPAEAINIIEKERNRKFSKKELSDYLIGYEELLELISRPSRNASQEEIDLIQKLLTEA